jgi:two-component system, cell cycle sensor histidine kinase and response regulator CckA
MARCEPPGEEKAPMQERTAALEEANARLQQEVAERQQAEAALRKSQATLLRAQQVAHVGNWVWHIRENRLEWSDEMYRIFAMQPEEFRGDLAEVISRAIHPEDRAVVEASNQSVIEAGKPVPVEYRIVWPDGTVRTVWAEAGDLILDDEGNPVMLTGIVQDITERKRVERAAQESEEKYRALFNQSVSGIFLHDLEGRILDVNETACLQSGYTREELLRLTVFDLHPKGVGRSTMPREEILRVWSGWQPEQRSTVEAEHQSKDGTVVPVEISTGVVRYGERRLMLALVQDISERKRAAAEQQELQTRLAQAQKMEAVGRLAGGVAHDFNNMLGVIIGHAELAMRQIDPNHPLYTDLVEIHHAAQRSADLTRQLLAFARKQLITPVVLQLNDTIEPMLKMLRRLIGEDIQLDWRPGAALWPVKIDPGQFSQILINLCLNARDAIVGAGAISIETQNVVRDTAYSVDKGWFVPGEYVQLAVSDTGCGMDQEVQANLFEPYFTTKLEGQSGGLGLATVYGAVKQNKGFVHIYSEPGQGTTVKIYLPRAVGQVVAIEPARPGVSGGQETVLVVEDEPAILRLATAVLERLGYTVLTANHPGEALARATQHAGTIDLLVTDVVMPEMNGRELAARVMANHPRLKCLFMSGYTANVIARQGVLDEGVWFLQKPFSIDQLARKVREVLEEA